MMAKISVLAPLDGTVVELEKVPDEVFAQKMAGDGVAIDPSGQVAVAPVAGDLVKLFPGGHAFGIAMGNGVELIGILAFRASPVWVLAALADASGAGRYLIREIATSLQEEGLLDRTAKFTTVDEMLDGLEASAGRLAATVNTPPLDVATLRQEWAALRRDFLKIPPKQLPRMQVVRDLWKEIHQTAQKENRTVFQVSSLMAMSAINTVPEKARWLSASARSAARKTGVTVASVLLNDYRATLNHIRNTGYIRYAARQLSPYVSAAVSQFSPRRSSLTEKMLSRSSRGSKKYS